MGVAADRSLHILHRRRLAESGPLLQEPASLLEHVAAPVSSHLVRQRMRQRLLRDLARVRGGPAHHSRKHERKPCTVSSPRPMRRSSRCHGHVAQRLPARPPGQTQSPALDPRSGSGPRSTSTVAGESGTRCSLPAFMREDDTQASRTSLVSLSPHLPTPGRHVGRGVGSGKAQQTRASPHTPHILSREQYFKRAICMVGLRTPMPQPASAVASPLGVPLWVAARRGQKTEDNEGLRAERWWS